MLVRIGQGADHGFDQPLGLLSDCHRRIEHFLATLTATAAARRGGALNDADCRAVDAALRYFDTAAPRHTADEEESLFPRLRAAGHPASQAALEALQRLEADHRLADEHHDCVARLYRRWIGDGTLPDTDALILRERLAALERLYRDHLAIEDREIFPSAGRVLNRAELEAVGREMARRPAWRSSREDRTERNLRPGLLGPRTGGRGPTRRDAQARVLRT